jgi:hypothetical protein
MPISKLEAAQRQLDCAIRLYFDNDDLLSVHALSRAAFRVIYDLHKPADEYRAIVEQTIKYLGWANFNAVTNFLKHADRDPLDQSEEPTEEGIQVGIGFAAMLYQRLAGYLTPEMKAFHLWMKVRNPDKFPSVREPDWEFEQDYLDANEVLKDAPREARMLTGKVLLQLLRKDAEQTEH